MNYLNEFINFLRFTEKEDPLLMKSYRYAFFFLLVIGPLVMSVIVLFVSVRPWAEIIQDSDDNRTLLVRSHGNKIALVKYHGRMSLIGSSRGTIRVYLEDGTNSVDVTPKKLSEKIFDPVSDVSCASTQIGPMLRIRIYEAGVLTDTIVIEEPKP